MTDNTHFITDGKISIKLGATSTVLEYTLGARATGNLGTVWRYVRASTAIAQYDVVNFGTDWYAVPATATLVATGDMVGVAQVAFAAGEYGWVCTEADKISVNVSSSATAATQLYIATTAGSLSTTSSSGTLAGIHLTTSPVTTGVTLATAVMRAPTYKVL